MRVVAIIVVTMLVTLTLPAWASISSMNAALRRYVHPTGRCGADPELLATSYGNGDGALGSRMACGGRLDRSRPTIAHRHWPCGTQVLLRRHGRSVVATVTDRGPFTIAKIDMSPAVWRRLGGDNSYYVCARRLD